MFSMCLGAGLFLAAIAGGDSTAGTPVVMRFGGDCILSNHYEESVGSAIDSAFKAFDVLNTADISVVNLESPVTTRGEKVEKPYNFRMRPGLLGPLVRGGVDVVCLANNHVFDYGDEGLFDTISYLDSIGLWHIGAGRTFREARTPVIVHAGRRRIALQAYYGGSEAPAAAGNRGGVAARDLSVIGADIRAFRMKDSADYVVVIFHWGTEKATEPDEAQIAFAHAVIDSGADAVIGHHPHVLQGIERYRQGVIVYSLGNLVFGGNSRDTYDTGLFEIRLWKGRADYEFIPIRVSGWKLSRMRSVGNIDAMKQMRELSSIFPKSIFITKEKR